MICGGKLAYLTRGRALSCIKCGKKEIANITCPRGHYVCDECHGEGLFEAVTEYVLASPSKDPFAIAEELMARTDIPMLGCEHAWIAAGALMAALRNEGTLKLKDNDIREALNRTRRQAIGGYCGLTGICGIAPGIGAAFSVILGAACPKDVETRMTMETVGKVVQAIAGQAGPCCCKNFVRTALRVVRNEASHILQVELPAGEGIHCAHSQHHPHGCREEKCLFFLQGDQS